MSTVFFPKTIHRISRNTKPKCLQQANLNKTPHVFHQSNITPKKERLGNPPTPLPSPRHRAGPALSRRGDKADFLELCRSMTKQCEGLEEALRAASRFVTSHVLTSCLATRSKLSHCFLCFVCLFWFLCLSYFLFAL